MNQIIPSPTQLPEKARFLVLCTHLLPKLSSLLHEPRRQGFAPCVHPRPIWANTIEQVPVVPQLALGANGADLLQDPCWEHVSVKGNILDQPRQVYPLPPIRLFQSLVKNLFSPQKVCQVSWSPLDVVYHPRDYVEPLGGLRGQTPGEVLVR